MLGILLAAMGVAFVILLAVLIILSLFVSKDTMRKILNGGQRVALFIFASAVLGLAGFVGYAIYMDGKI